MSTAILETPEYLATISANDTALQATAVLQEWADSVIQGIDENVPQDRLIEIGRDAHSLEKASFRIRGCVGAEIKRRIRLQGDKQIGRALSRVAKDMQIAPSTLDEDSRIFEEFGDELRTDTDLDREHFRVALSAPDPHEALEMARNKRAENSSYSTRNFRDDVLALNGGKAVEKVDRLWWINERLESEDARAAWSKLTSHYASNAEALSAAIIKLAEELS